MLGFKTTLVVALKLIGAFLEKSSCQGTALELADASLLAFAQSVLAIGGEYDSGQLRASPTVRAAFRSQVFGADAFRALLERHACTGEGTRGLVAGSLANVAELIRVTAEVGGGDGGRSLRTLGRRLTDTSDLVGAADVGLGLEEDLNGGAVAHAALSIREPRTPARLPGCPHQTRAASRCAFARQAWRI